MASWCHLGVTSVSPKLFMAVPSPSPTRPSVGDTLRAPRGRATPQDVPVSPGQCFMNAVLQCLSSTKPLRDYCLRRDFQQEQPPGPRAPQELTEGGADPPKPPAPPPEPPRGR